MLLLNGIESIKWRLIKYIFLCVIHCVITMFVELLLNWLCFCLMIWMCCVLICFCFSIVNWFCFIYIYVCFRSVYDFVLWLLCALCLFVIDVLALAYYMKLCVAWMLLLLCWCLLFLICYCSFVVLFEYETIMCLGVQPPPSGKRLPQEPTL